MNNTNPKIRNIAIIAHVDHGKTTLVDALFRQSGTFRENQDVAERVMDRMDLEKERGITIAAKNCAINWKGVKINIIDTPGHADFGGEVERALSMVNGVILLVDASEGPLPQTRFVLKKALEKGLKTIVVVNKIDRGDARPQEVLNEVYDLYIDLDADESQLDFPVFYAIGRQGIAQKTLTEKGENLHILLDAIVDELPAPTYDTEAPFQMMVSDLDYSDYLGRLCVGRVQNGFAKSGDPLILVGEGGQSVPLKVSKLQVYSGVGFADAAEVGPGDICILSGISDVKIGDTVCTRDRPEALKRLSVDEPTVAMNFYRNSGPFGGTEGKFVQPGKIRERLEREALRNVSIRVEESPDKESYTVKGRGEFQMAIIIETMRREGYEFCVGRPSVILKMIDGKKKEPIEHLFIDCEEIYTGIVTEKLSQRKCRMTNMVNHGSGRVRLEFSAPSRALIGYRDEFLTDTKGTGLMNSYLAGYEDYRGEIPSRSNGSLVADRQGNAVAYGIFHLEPRGRIFVVPGDKVYEGMIVGEHNREIDLDINVCKEKKLSNMRSAGKDDNIILTPVQPMTLEACLNFLRDDEMLEVTPKSLRLRKAILPQNERHLFEKRSQKVE
ncbi:MAG: translational GTPase TypA [Spirochaetales bacterium]|nr:translational GTPase TypA [Spirochaetales bacterium]